MASPTSLSSSYLPHLNGLRALAILGVLIYHLRASYCPAGYFGVDLFLVISGFLLLRSLLKPGAEQSFHYGSYLLKKAWRIIPSWFLVTIVVCALAAYLFHPGRMGDILKTARYSAIFQADYHIDRSGDYFNIFSQQNPLLHYWYLSITQQLYIVAPLLLIPLTRWCSRRAAIILLGGLSALSLAYYILTTSSALVPEELSNLLLHSLGTKTAYYHLVPRFWEIAAGVGVLLLPEFERFPKLRGTLGILGLAGIVASFYLYDTGSPAIYLTIICSLLALRYANSGPAAYLLGLRPVQALGTISFSLYLWHWPVMVFWKYCCMDAPGVWDEVGMMALSLLLGTLSWYAIERIKTPSLAGWKGTLLRGSLLLTIPFILVSMNKANKYMRKQMEAQPQRQIMLAASPVTETDAAVLRGLERLPEFDMPAPLYRIGVAEATPSFILMGDSHALHIYDALHEACTRAGVRGVHLNNGVLPYWNLIHPRHSAADSSIWNEPLANMLLDYLNQHPEIRYVVIAQFWEYRMKKGPAADGSSGYGQDWRTGKPLTSEEERMAVTGPGLGEFCDRIRALGKGVILLGDNPTFHPPAPLDEWERCQQLNRGYRERTISASEHESTQAFSHSIHRQLAAEGRAHYIDLAEAMMENGLYPARSGGQFLYQDVNHLSPAGSRRAIQYLMPRLLELLNHPAQAAPRSTP